MSMTHLISADALSPAEALLTRADRRAWIFSEVRKAFRKFVDDDGRWLSPPANYAAPDPRALVQVAIAYLHGDEADRALACRLLTAEVLTERLVSKPPCAFAKEYVLTLLHTSGHLLPDDVRELLVARATCNLHFYASLDLRHHGYNDNHVTLATAALVLGAEWIGDAELLEEGRANLLNFRDTLLRRGFMHEANDCYIPHTLYPLAAIAEWARDEEIRQLALDAEARVWSDWLGHWHPNLARKPGPSARDYTRGRLHPLTVNVALWSIFGDGFGQPAFPPGDLFAERLHKDRAFNYNGPTEDGSWDLGFVSYLATHEFHVPEAVESLAFGRSYPHIIRGTHETGHMAETVSQVSRNDHGEVQKTSRLLSGVVPFSAREIFTYQYQERDWAMGTASQRMLGTVPNNNWGVYWRKAAPLERTADQGLLFCSMTLNEKTCTGNHAFTLDAAAPQPQNAECVEHWYDNGRYAAVQHERTSIMLYRPRVHDRNRLSSVATSLVFPLCFNNRPQRVELGDRVIADFSGESEKLVDLFVEDGPLFIGVRALMPVALPADVRVRVERTGSWGVVHFYSYRGPALDLAEEDLCRIGGGFLCEVATREQFASLAEFKAWFRRGEVIDEQQFFMRHVRYHREGLDLALRWDVWADNIMYRALNGRDYPTPKFSCTGIDASQLPWLTGKVDGLDHFQWAKRQAARRLLNWPDQPLVLTRAAT